MAVRMRGFLIALLVATVLVTFFWFVKTGEKTPLGSQVSVYSKAQTEVTKSNLQNLEKSVLSYISEQGRAPESLQDLRNSGVLSGVVVDGWGSAITYERISDSSFRLISPGKDKALGTPDDVIIED